jgi:CspA family cold shock protein
MIEQTNGDDVYLHSSQVIGDGLKYLLTGQLVEFEVVQGPKGQRAANVVPFQARDAVGKTQGAAPKQTPGADPNAS